MTGYLRGLIADEERRELAAVIERYRRGELPLAVPMAAIAGYAEQHQVLYLLDQVYLQRSD